MKLHSVSQKKMAYQNGIHKKYDKNIRGSHYLSNILTYSPRNKDSSTIAIQIWKIIIFENSVLNQSVMISYTK